MAFGLCPLCGEVSEENPKKGRDYTTDYACFSCYCEGKTYRTEDHEAQS